MTSTRPELDYDWPRAAKEGEMTVLRRIGVLSCAKILGLLYFGLGLIVGAIISLVVVVGGALDAGHVGPGRALLGVFLGAGAVVVLPICYGMLGFVLGALAAAIYNLAAKMAGGLEFELVASQGESSTGS
jgi:hypothetical protein